MAFKDLNKAQNSDKCGIFFLYAKIQLFVLYECDYLKNPS